MALSKTNKQTANIGPKFSTPPNLIGFVVTTTYQILDDADGSTINVSKDVDVWPLLTVQQQTTLQNLIQNIVSLAVSRA